MVFWRWSLSRFPLKNQVSPWTTISCLQTFLFLLYASSSLKRSFRSFPSHHELSKGKSSFQECKIVKNENRAYEERAILLTSDQISPAITGDPNAFLSILSEGLLLRPKCEKLSTSLVLEASKRR